MAATRKTLHKVMRECAADDLSHVREREPTAVVKEIEDHPLEGECLGESVAHPA